MFSIGHNPTKLEQSIDASIELDNLQLSYTPGSVLRGVVKRVEVDNDLHPVTVDLGLIGRVFTKVQYSNGSADRGNDHYWAESELVRTGTRVYQGPVAPRINAWQFTLPIPLGFIADGVDTPIPTSHYSNSWEATTMNGRRDYLYCEYYLEACVSNARKPRKPFITRLPLFIRPPSSETDLTDFRIMRFPFKEEVKTLLLDPAQDGGLSVKQRFQSVFHRSTLPQFGFTLFVDLPTLIQTENPNILPIRLRASPDHEITNMPCLLEKPPKITLVAMRIRLQYATTVSNLEGPPRASNTEGRETDLSRIDWEADEDGPQIPTGPEHEVDALEIGRFFELRLAWNGFRHSGYSAPQRSSWRETFNPSNQKYIAPSSETYFLSQRYQFDWSVTVMCGGKKRKIEAITPVQVIGPSEGWEAEILRYLGPEQVAIAHKSWAECLERVPAVGRGMGDPPATPQADVKG